LSESQIFPFLSPTFTTTFTTAFTASLLGLTKKQIILISAGASPFLRDHIRELTAAEWARLCGKHMFAEIINRSANANTVDQGTNDNATSLVHDRMLPNVNKTVLL